MKAECNYFNHLQKDAIPKFNNFNGKCFGTTCASRESGSIRFRSPSNNYYLLTRANKYLP